MATSRTYTNNTATFPSATLEGGNPHLSFNEMRADVLALALTVTLLNNSQGLSWISSSQVEFRFNGTLTAQDETDLDQAMTDYTGPNEAADHEADEANPHAVTAAQAGAAPTSHTHVEADVTDLGTYVKADGSTDITGDQSMTGALSVAGELQGKCGVNAQTGTAYTLVAADNGKLVTLDNASAITLTVNTGLPAGFNCTVLQKGAGQVTLAGSATKSNRQSHTKTAGQWAAVTFVWYATDAFLFQGDTA